MENTDEGKIARKIMCGLNSMKEYYYKKIDGFVFIGNGKYLKDVFGFKVLYMPGGCRFEVIGIKCECQYIPLFKEEVPPEVIKKYIEGFMQA